MDGELSEMDFWVERRFSKLCTMISLFFILKIEMFSLDFYCITHILIAVL